MRILAFWVAKEGKPGTVSGVEFAVSSKFGIRVEHIDIEGYEGERLAKQYGVSAVPTIVAVSNAGSVLQSWTGYSVPTMDELQHYVDRGM